MKNLKVVAFALLGMLCLAGVSHAESITVSSSTVTQIVSGNTGRDVLCIQNASINDMYFSKFSSSATATAGVILKSSATWSQPFCLLDFRGAIYGKAAAGASSDIRYIETLR